MAGEDVDPITCLPRLPAQVWVKSRCGRGRFFDRDCLGGDSYGTLPGAICNAYAFNANSVNRYVEFWTEDKNTYLFTMKAKGYGEEKARSCFERVFKRERAMRGSLQFGADADPYTVKIPGFDDIVKTGASSNAEEKKDKVNRFKLENSALPDFLKWAPPLLNKLDDAQDILQTGLLLAWPILKKASGLVYQGTMRVAAGSIPIVRSVAPRILGPLGILLTVNDLLNMAT